MAERITKDTVITKDHKGRKLSPDVSRGVTAFAQAMRTSGERKEKEKGKVPMLKKKEESRETA